MIQCPTCGNYRPTAAAHHSRAPIHTSRNRDISSAIERAAPEIKDAATVESARPVHRQCPRSEGKRLRAAARRHLHAAHRGVCVHRHGVRAVRIDYRIVRRAGHLVRAPICRHGPISARRVRPHNFSGMYLSSSAQDAEQNL